MSYQEIMIVLILAIWLIINICYAIFNNRVAKITYRTDIFRLISAFQLFSRKISSFDLSYRDLLADQSITSWENVSLNHRWRLYQAIWFPQSIPTECVKSIVDDLTGIAGSTHPKHDAKKISDRFIYRAVFHFLKRYPSDRESLGRQFRICDYEKRELFVSDFYK